MFKKNQKITLVLSGGAALGFAHFGVIKSLEEKQIIPNEIIGTSMGAIAGTFLASNYSYKEIENFIEELKYLKLLKINIFSGNSLIDHTKIRKYLHEKIGNKTFSQLETNLKIIATNIENGELKLFDKINTPNTQIIDAVCASISIPGIFKPYKIENEIFVDGLLTSNFPIEFSTNKKIIGINVITENFVKNKKFKYTPQMIEKSLYILQLNQTKNKIKENKNKQLKVINIDLEEFKSYEFHKWMQIQEQGYIQFKEKYLE